jgi:hypothetical protein
MLVVAVALVALALVGGRQLARQHGGPISARDAPVTLRIDTRNR